MKKELERKKWSVYIVIMKLMEAEYTLNCVRIAKKDIKNVLRGWKHEKRK